MQTDKITPRIYKKIHSKQLKTSGFNRVMSLYSNKQLGLSSNYFKGKVCADFGGGNGSGAINLINLGAKKVYLIDLNDSFLKIKNKKYKDKIIHCKENIIKTSFKKNYFDFVLCSNAIHHTSQPSKVLKEIFRVLNGNGKSLISVNGKYGLIGKIINKVIKVEYKNNPTIKRLIDELLNNKLKRYNKFFFKRFTIKEKFFAKELIKKFDDDFILTLKDRILSPKYVEFSEKKFKHDLKKIGFKRITRIKSNYVKYDNIRFLLAPFYYEYKNILSKALYGEGNIKLFLSK